ncbi:MAG: 2-C-methyl-D-erythritol 4-phosphate cytidylyltransferase [Candidatus Omnitrophota bacterium]
MFVSAVVPGAGLGRRLGHRIPKALVKLGQVPIFIHTLNILSRHPKIKEIILVLPSDSLNSARRYLKKYPIKKIKQLVIGGARRTDSVRNGLKIVSRGADLVLVHDAVRPFLSLSMISAVINKAEKCGAAILGVPVKPTIKEVNADGEVIRTLLRSRLYEVQTPQVFQRDLIINAYRRFHGMAAVDDAILVERLGKKVRVVKGSYLNIKITTPEDLVFARSILN